MDFMVSIRFNKMYITACLNILIRGNNSDVKLDISNTTEIKKKQKRQATYRAIMKEKENKYATLSIKQKHGHKTGV